MTCVKDIYDYLNRFAPVSAQEDFDNSGLIVGDANAPVDKVILALDATGAVIDEAGSKGAQLIITHHPVIFGGFKKVLPSDPTGMKIYSLCRKGITVISMHTNLDKADGGVNDALIRALGVSEPEPADPAVPYIRYGCLDEKMPLSDYLEFCRTALKSDGLRYYDSGKPVHRIACIGGAGDFGISDVVALGCDTFVTADIRYHVFLEAAEYGINLIDGDHFCTENPVVSVLLERLAAEFPEVAFEVSGKHCQTARFFK